MVKSQDIETDLARSALVSNYESLRSMAIKSDREISNGGIGLAILRYKGLANLISAWSSQISTTSLINKSIEIKTLPPTLAPEIINSQVTSLLASMILGNFRESYNC